MRIDELEKAIEEQKREPKKQRRKISLGWYILLIFILLIIVIRAFLIDNTEEKEGIITLKYKEDKDYKFEIDNKTIIYVEKRDYLKYEVDDNYIYNEKQITTQGDCIIIYPITFLFCSVFLIKRLEEKPWIEI